MTEYSTYYLNNTGSRWVRLDRFGNKDKITLETKSGKLEIITTLTSLVKR